MNSKTAYRAMWIYVSIAVIFLLYEQPWNVKAWTDSDGVVQTATAWKYVIFWPYAIYAQTTKK